MKKKISVLSLFFLILFLILPSYSLAQDKGAEKKYAADELIVKFKKDKEPEGEKFEGFDLQPIFANHQNDELGQFYKIKLPKTTDLKKAQVDFENTGVVEQASLNYFAHSAYTPNDPNYASQWALSKINMAAAWDHTLGSSNVVIANIDTGVDTDHPDIANKIWTNPGESGGGKETNGIDDDGNGFVDDWRGWDFVAFDYFAPCTPRPPGDDNLTPDNNPNPKPNGINEDANPLCNPYDTGTDSGVDHGTATAGIAAAATNNATGIAGVCPECKLMALRVLDDEGWGTWSQIAAGIVYAADNGADVISMSLAGDYSGLGTAMNDAIHYAYSYNKVIVAAAGNDNMNLDNYPLSPVCNDDDEYQYGGENQVVGVGATTSSDLKASFSNYGKTCVDISAPGTLIHTLRIAETDGGYFYGTFGGTSAATPFVAGVAGLVKSQNPTWDNKAIRDATIDLIHNINALNPSYSGTLGGRLDANRALDSTERLNGSGTLIKGSGPSIYLLQNGQKRFIPSAEVYFSYSQNWNYYVAISDSRLNDYPNGPDLLFREGTLVKASNNVNVYQIEYPSSTKRFITSPDVFLGLGYQWEDIITTSSAIISQHPTGSNINSLGTHVSGALVKTSSSDNVYLLSAGAPKVRHLIINPQVFTINFRWQDIAQVSEIEMATYADGDNYRYQDGSALKGSGPNIYLLSYGKKRLFLSPEAYLGRGYNWSQFISVTDEELTHYSSDEDLN